jgi:hypothetical protein
MSRVYVVLISGCNSKVSVKLHDQADGSVARKEKTKPLPSGQQTWCAKRFSASCVLSSSVARAFGARNENYELLKITAI